MAKRALGRGIDALFGSIAEDNGADDAQRVLNLPIGQVDINPEQPRKRFDKEKLEELAASIRNVGILQPITVYAQGDRYVIIAGERRYRAARIAGLSEVPAIVRDEQRLRRMEMALIENLQRDDLNPIEEARALHILIEQVGVTQEQLAQRVGKSRPALTNLLRLLELPNAVIEMVEQGLLTQGHARALLALQGEEARIAMAKMAVEKSLSVRQVEALCAPAEKAAAKPVRQKQATEDELTVQEAAIKAFGTKVEVRPAAKGGTLVVHYYGREDLERIYHKLADE